MLIVFQQPKKKKKIIIREPKKSCVIGETNANFFANTVNWYKYQLIVVSY